METAIHTYVNNNGNKFIIRWGSADIPNNADYWGYLFEVEVVDNKNLPLPSCTYKAFVKKSYCKDLNELNAWFKMKALPFLEGILETYRDGKTSIYLPYPLTFDWFVL